MEFAGETTLTAIKLAVAAPLSRLILKLIRGLRNGDIERVMLQDPEQGDSISVGLRDGKPVMQVQQSIPLDEASFEPDKSNGAN